VIEPQWSTPIQQRDDVRVAEQVAVVLGVAAMEPADEQRDDWRHCHDSCQGNAAAMEPAGERRDDPQRRGPGWPGWCRRNGARPWSAGRPFQLATNLYAEKKPQWNPPMNSGTTYKAGGFPPGTFQPQWSPPVNGGTTGMPQFLAHPVAAP
jgi:hypothetical protein